MANNLSKPLATRERFAAYLVLLLIRIVAPWEYEHQFTEVVKEINTILKEDA